MEICNVSAIVSADNGFFMFDVISSTLNKLTPWSGVEVNNSKAAAAVSGVVNVDSVNTPSRVGTGLDSDLLNFSTNSIIVDSLI